MFLALPDIYARSQSTQWLGPDRWIPSQVRHLRPFHFPHRDFANISETVDGPMEYRVIHPVLAEGSVHISSDKVLKSRFSDINHLANYTP